MTAGDPLPRLQAWQRQAELPAAALRALAAQASPAAAAALVLAFDRALDVHRRHQQGLAIEMVDAMAGSDPVCIRELGEALALQLQDVQRRWQALRGTLLAGGAADAAALLALADVCEALQRREQREWLPMAARLLDDAALGRLAQAAAPRSR
ncbi:MAG: hypothetical protein QM750_03925 [Rubrivivax sp.]